MPGPDTTRTANVPQRYVSIEPRCDLLACIHMLPPERSQLSTADSVYPQQFRTSDPQPDIDIVPTGLTARAVAINAPTGEIDDRMKHVRQIEQLPFSTKLPEPILMPLYLRNYRRIWDGIKLYEFRKRFVSVPTVWYVYVGPPVFKVIATIELGAPHYAPVSDLAEFVRPDHPAGRDGLRRYFAGYSHGYAVPIHSVYEHQPVPRSELPGLRRVPNDLLPLRWNHTLLATLQTRFSLPPVRELHLTQKSTHVDSCPDLVSRG